MIQLGIVVAYLAVLVVLGLSAHRLFRGTAQDYLLASRSIGPFLLMMSIFGTTMTAFALVGSTGKSYGLGAGVYGMLASAGGIVHSLCFFTVGIKLWTFGRRFGYTTQIEFFRDRLESGWIGLLLFPVLVGMVIPYLLVGVISGGAVVSNVTRDAFREYGYFADNDYGVPAWLASLCICLVVLTYVFFGGMRGTAWANTFQTLVFLVLGLVTFHTVAEGLGGKDNFLDNLRAASAAVSESQLTREKIPKTVYFSFLLIPLSVCMFPHVFQHWLTARSAKAFRLPIVMHPILIMIVWLPCVLIGVWASAADLPSDLNENAVLARMVHDYAGPVLAGLLTAGILAAIMSSLDSQFLCVGTIFTKDILLYYGKREHYSDRRQVVAARLFVVGVVGFTYFLSLLEPRSIFAMGIWCFSGLTGLFPLVTAALYWKRLTLAGATASILTMGVTWAALFRASQYGLDKTYAFPEAPIAIVESVAIPPMMPVVTIFLASSLALVLVSLVTKPPSEATLARFFPGRGG